MPYWPSGCHARHWHWRVKTLLASNYCTFLQEKAKQYRDPKWNLHLYSAHRSNEHCERASGHSCSQRAQLVGVTLHWLRGPILTENFIFLEAKKFLWQIYDHRG